ncbi:hypothetical protein CAPTEDRAFT_206907 [Capitella teleta]|uniref:G-protein coupled receptors family 1 profile domain-containing protein n=1 Tax=Capitella teleta TaxID=283909 RepID=R7UGP7_CAPTE|nr:hypothetical protein CAPTEDRAFT_206907 [Capitella teleta]|eukprot:ELU05278.1 hypothetical protein CAPTEDRAFT_206907 [Capitella teleta]
MASTDVPQPESTASSLGYNTTGYNVSTPGASPQIACQLPIAFNITVNVILVSTICILGLAGNTLSMIVLHRERGNRVPVLLLQALAVADNACLVLTLIYVPFILGILPSLPRYSNTVRTVAVYFRKYVEPLAHMAQTATIWMVVLLAANRYIAICQPFRAQSYLTMRRTKIQMIILALFSVLFNAPRFLQSRIAIDTATGHTVLRATSIGPDSKFGEIYTNALYTMLVLVLPFILLLVLNVCLVVALRASRRRMRRNSVNRVEANENNITLVMVVVVVVFFCCLLPDRLVPILVRMLDMNGCFLYVFMCICNLLFVVNSSVNFFIYYVFRRRFRKILLTHICGCPSTSNQRSESHRILQLHSHKHTQHIRFSGSSQRSDQSMKCSDSSMMH